MNLDSKNESRFEKRIDSKVGIQDSIAEMNLESPITKNFESYQLYVVAEPNQEIFCVLLHFRCSWQVRFLPALDKKPSKICLTRVRNLFIFGLI